MEPKVSIIVPNFNHAAFLRQRIDSILNQTFHDFELILLDDCSTDNSREILDSYRTNPKVSHVIYNEVNSGTAFRQWDKGIELARGEWIWIAESDDWADDNFLEVLLTTSIEYPDAGLIYSKARYMRNGEECYRVEVDGSVVCHKREFFLRNTLLFSNPLYNVSMLIFKKSVYQVLDHEKYTSMHLCGDWMMYTLMAEQTNIVEIRRFLSYYRLHESNTSLSAEKEGLTFLEGISIIDEIVRFCHLSWISYARTIGRQWTKYQQKYKFTQSVNGRICKAFWKNHKMVVNYHLLYTLWNKKKHA